MYSFSTIIFTLCLRLINKSQFSWSTKPRLPRSYPAHPLENLGAKDCILFFSALLLKRILSLSVCVWYVCTSILTIGWRVSERFVFDFIYFHISKFVDFPFFPIQFCSLSFREWCWLPTKHTRKIAIFLLWPKGWFVSVLLCHADVRVVLRARSVLVLKISYILS